MFAARLPLAVLALLLLMHGATWAQEAKTTRTYENRLARIDDPRPILADYPEFVEPVVCPLRFEAPPLVDDDQADLAVRAWRFSYNARGVVEIPNRLRGRDTAVIVVHPWGIDDGQGWTTPEPAGIAFLCTAEKNEICNRHMKEVVDPLLKRLRGRVALVMYSLPGTEDPIRRQIYRSFRGQPSDAQRKAGGQALTARLRSFDYHGEPLPNVLTLSQEHPVADYLRQFGGTDAGDRFNAEGFWNMPIPVNRNIQVAPDDVVIYDAEGYEPLRDYLRAQGIRHVLLAGYNTDMCFCATTAGYDHLSPDFNVFLVGDATLATFPANPSPKFATNASISLASREHLITQASWIEEGELLDVP
ncbi:MAG TPA: isochorismatase family protein [Pirellulales bacterium]|nr:isochorismatase family protein [Pirellulales bacterium]